MIRPRLHLLCLVALLTSGCSLWPLQKEEVAHPSVKEYLSQAEQLRGKKRYSEAGNLLTQAALHYPEQAKIHRLMEAITSEREGYHQLLSDQLLVARISYMQQQRPLLEKLAVSEADDLYASSRLIQIAEEMEKQQPMLSACGKRYLKTETATAERCLQLALAIKEDENDRKHLIMLENEKKMAEQKQAQEREKQKIKKMIKRAQLNYSRGEYYKALVVIDSILTIAPKSSEALALKNKIKGELDSHTNNLLTAGDTLYRKGQIDSAIAAWNTALIMDPKNEQAKDKITRASKVITNLEQLRQQQQTADQPMKIQR